MWSYTFCSTARPRGIPGSRSTLADPAGCVLIAAHRRVAFVPSVIASAVAGRGRCTRSWWALLGPGAYTVRPTATTAAGALPSAGPTVVPVVGRSFGRRAIGPGGFGRGATGRRAVRSADCSGGGNARTGGQRTDGTAGRVRRSRLRVRIRGPAVRRTAGTARWRRRWWRARWLAQRHDGDQRSVEDVAHRPSAVQFLLGRARRSSA